jgi:septum formation protein
MNKINLAKLPPIILASASPRREMLLKEAGIPFKVLPAALDEPEHEYLSPEEQALFHAFRKANKIASQYPDHLVIGADTIVCLGNKLYGKPATLEVARQYLKELSGKVHRVITGICLKYENKKFCELFNETTEVEFLDLDDKRINEYLSKVNVLDKAGAYGIQEHGDMIIKTIRGSYTNVVGLPVETLVEHLKKIIF